MKAIWNGVVLAESSDTKVVEGIHYFPPDDVSVEYLKTSSTRTTFPGKGVANYYHVVVDGKRCEDGAWTYPAPEDAAAAIKDHIAFGRGVEVAGSGPLRAG